MASATPTTRTSAPCSMIITHVRRHSPRPPRRCATTRPRSRLLSRCCRRKIPDLRLRGRRCSPRARSTRAWARCRERLGRDRWAAAGCGVVSLNKTRFQRDDLTYITPRIIAMGFPSVGLEERYRNNLEQVQRFLGTYHPQPLPRVQPARSYHGHDLGGESYRTLHHYPFDDHNPPAMSTRSASTCRWLERHPDNVRRPPGGKGRPEDGLVLPRPRDVRCDTAENALDFGSVHDGGDDPVAEALHALVRATLRGRGAATAAEDGELEAEEQAHKMEARMADGSALERADLAARAAAGPTSPRRATTSRAAAPPPPSRRCPSAAARAACSGATARAASTRAAARARSSGATARAASPPAAGTRRRREGRRHSRG